MEQLALSLGVFIRYPFLAAVIGVILIISGGGKRRRGAAAGGVEAVVPEIPMVAS